jgi:clan AA aspartic protease (TIGR02281 family)
MDAMNANQTAIGAFLATLFVLAAWFWWPDAAPAPPCDRCLTLTAREHSGDNSFQVTASINGISDTYQVDTGASSVALPGSYLSKLRLNPARLPKTQTSSIDRTVAGYEVTLPRLRVGPCELRNIRAVIIPDMIDGPLLGMTAINQMGVKIENGRLSLTCQATSLKPGRI